MLSWLWRSRLTWRAAVPLTAALCLAIVATAGIGGTVGGIALIGSVVVWLLLLARLSDNEARHVLATAQASGRPAPERRVRRLLFPWWARAVAGLGALALTAAAFATLDSDGLTALVFLLAAGTAWLVERAVITLRSPRASH